ncbi:hypothetical protein NPIL_205651, partial [Nephila pilipes]
MSSWRNLRSGLRFGGSKDQGLSRDISPVRKPRGVIIQVMGWDG